MKEHISRAIRNVAAFGDTDIFPFPIENHIFFDRHDDVKNLLNYIDKHFDDYFQRYPPINQSGLAPVGYVGFRWATQIDPIWNAYFLSLVLSLADEIERARIKVDQKVIFSYRYKPDDRTGAIFDLDYGWPQFQERSLELADEFKYILICDISDFYSRIYHHRLENSLLQLQTGTASHSRIMTMLGYFSNNNSYGLPIGGPAARLLSELLLNRTDRLFLTNGLTFCRFADDYHIFANSSEEAYQALVFISEKLLRNEGLSLQKTKTRIMPTSEFKGASDFHAQDEGASPERDFLKLSLRFDPYSQTAVEDYEELRNHVAKYDITGMLARELQKSRIHSPLTKKLVRAIKYLPDNTKRDAVLSMLKNIDVLAPIFSAVMITLKELFHQLDDTTRDHICTAMRGLIIDGSYLTKIDINLAFAVRLLASQYSEESETVLAQTYNASFNAVIKRDIMLAMAKWRATHWISDRKNYYCNMGPWEKRGFILASYALRDEGRHWREYAKKEFSEFEIIMRDWAADKFYGTNIAQLPL